MPERPPKEWFDQTVRSMSKNPDITDPKQLAGWLWSHGLTPETKSAILAGERPRGRRFDFGKIKGRFKKYRKVPYDVDEKLPKPRDFYGYDHTMVRVVKDLPDTPSLIEVGIRLPQNVFDELLEYLENVEHLEVTDDGERIIRRGKTNAATNIFIDRE